MSENKMQFQTPDGAAANIAKLNALFPNLVTEGKVNLDALRTFVGEEVWTNEAYEFTWVGKRAAVAEAGRPIRKTLRPCRAESRDWDTTENLYIEGDNLDVLKLLQESYLGKVKMIYIDPPYNTGNDCFLYPDNFRADDNEYDEQIDLFDGNGCKNFRENNETNPRFHSDWCSMMYPRLVLARNMLRDNGVIFISIDDNEVHNLRKICDEVFGAGNYVNTVAVNMKNTAGASGGGEDKRLKKNCEFILIYAKSYLDMPLFNNAYEYTELSELIQQYIDNKVSWKYTSVLVEQGEKVFVGSTIDGEGNDIKIYSRKNPIIKSIRQVADADGISEKEAYSKYGLKIFQTTNAQTSIRMRVMQSRQEMAITEDLLSIEYVPRSGRNKGQVYEQFYKGDMCRLFVWLKDTSEEIDGVLYKKDLQGTYWDYTPEMKNVSKEGEVVYPNGKKPIALIKRMAEMTTEQDSIILDFFSGSATTAHAVMQLNAEDGGKRKFIMVQLPEVCKPDSEAAKAGYKNICEIGKERIRRAGDKIKDAAGLMAQGLDVGFRVLKLDETNMRDVYYNALEWASGVKTDGEPLNFVDCTDNIKPDRTAEDLLYGCLLEWGLPLHLPHVTETIAGFAVQNYNDGDLLACFEPGVTEELIRELAARCKGREPLTSRVVFRDSSFADSPQKINLFEIFKLLAPNASVKVI
jgi:adenine-specific DNA-methyltransferase